MKRQPRRIVLLRHAKAEQIGATDRERELSPRGRADAAATGRWLAEQQVTPDCVLVSAATRTRQTWEHLAPAAGWSMEPTYDAGLYAAGPETMLDLVREAPDSATTVLVIGHNPTVAYLAQMLGDGAGDEAAETAMTQGFPTSAIAILEYDGTWADLDEGRARLAAYAVGRG